MKRKKHKCWYNVILSLTPFIFKLVKLAITNLNFHKIPSRFYKFLRKFLVTLLFQGRKFLKILK